MAATCSHLYIRYMHMRQAWIDNMHSASRPFALTDDTAGRTGFGKIRAPGQKSVAGTDRADLGFLSDADDGVAIEVDGHENS